MWVVWLHPTGVVTPRRHEPRAHTHTRGTRTTTGAAGAPGWFPNTRRVKLSSISLTAVLVRAHTYAAAFQLRRALTFISFILVRYLVHPRSSSFIVVHSRPLSFILVHSRSFSFILVHSRLFSFVISFILVHSRSFSFILVLTRSFSFLLVHSRSFSFILV